MSLIGCHSLVFSGVFDREGLDRSARITAESGFDLLELVLMDPFNFDISTAKDVLSGYDLTLAASMGLNAHTDVSSEDPEIVARGEATLNKVLEILNELGATYMVGVIYSALNKYSGPATVQGRKNSADVMRRLGERAQGFGIKVGLEVVNRYETNIMNTAREGVAFVNHVDHPNVGLHLDTYHMNIEEPDMFQPILDAADKLFYVHVGESHRGYLGSGTVDFASFFRALDRSGFDGPITFESFSSAVVEPDLSVVLAIWRNLWSDSSHLAKHANTFIRTMQESVKAIELQ